jgi:ribosome-binding factor A
MVSKKRTERIAERIFEELSTMILMELSDPRLSDVTLTHVKVDKELAFADIYVSSFLNQTDAEEILDGLEHAKGFIRRELSQRIQLRSFPKLRFRWDPVPEQAERIERLISSLHEDEDNAADSDEEQ